jgi:hypothetical protein
MMTARDYNKTRWASASKRLAKKSRKFQETMRKSPLIDGAPLKLAQPQPGEQ